MGELERVLARVVAGFPDGAGRVGLLSGDEFLPEAAAFDRALLPARARVGLVLCADHRARPQSARFAVEHFTGMGAAVATDDLVHGDPGALAGCDVVYVAGGSPAELLACLRREPAWTRILDAWRGGTVLAGSSAGAMALCEHCLTPEEGARVPTRWETGVGPVAGLGLAVHATSRSAEWMAQVASAAPCPVVALDDHTGVLLARDRPPDVTGPGRAWVVPSVEGETH